MKHITQTFTQSFRMFYGDSIAYFSIFALQTRNVITKTL